jgi:hypothetical protein
VLVEEVARQLRELALRGRYGASGLEVGDWKGQSTAVCVSARPWPTPTEQRPDFMSGGGVEQLRGIFAAMFTARCVPEFSVLSLDRRVLMTTTIQGNGTVSTIVMRTRWGARDESRLSPAGPGCSALPSNPDAQGLLLYPWCGVGSQRIHRVPGMERSDSVRLVGEA